MIHDRFLRIVSMSTDSSPVDRFCTILSDHERRSALTALAAGDTPMTLRDVTHEVVEREYDARISDAPSDAVEDVYLSLVHVHVPMLADAEVIEFDSNREVIEDVDLNDLEPLLSATREVEPRVEEAH